MVSTRSGETASHITQKDSQPRVPSPKVVIRKRTLDVSSDQGNKRIKTSPTRETNSNNSPTSADWTKPQNPALKRFGSEEGSPHESIHSEIAARKESSDQQLRSDDSSDDSSDDGTPEEATTGALQDKVGATAAKAAEDAAVKASLARAKRKEHEERMRAQRKATRKALNSKQSTADNSDQMYVDEASAAMKASPPLLPQEILDAEPTVRPLTPEPVTGSQKKVKLKRFVFDSERPAKDLVRGNTRIRVLPQEQSTLAPKSKTNSRQIREKWLLGQRGANPKAWVPREKPQGGFVRRSM